MGSRASFTLIELLIVLGIVAILSVVVILTLNPAQMLKQARDSNRLADLNTANKALSLFDTDVNGGFFGTSSVLYVSIPDPAATSTLGSDCAGIGFASTSIPAGWSYHCAASSTVRKTDGTGWIPVNFDQMSFRALAALPVDPVNQSSSNQYYTYAAGGSWELTALLESEKYQAKQVTDAGYDPGMYEAGNDLALSPFARGLRGYWKFDETGTTASDYSGMGNDATMYSSSSASDLHVASSSCLKGRCAMLDGVDDNVEVPHNVRLNISEELTISAWVYHSISTTTAQNWGILSKGSDGGGYNYGLFISYIFLRPVYSIYNGVSWYTTNSQGAIATSTLTHVVVTYKNAVTRFYLNGVLDSARAGASIGALVNTAVKIGGSRAAEGNNEELPGYLDEVRIYARALSDREILNLYNDR